MLSRKTTLKTVASASAKPTIKLCVVKGLVLLSLTILLACQAPSNQAASDSTTKDATEDMAKDATTDSVSSESAVSLEPSAQPTQSNPAVQQFVVPRAELANLGLPFVDNFVALYPHLEQFEQALDNNFFTQSELPLIENAVNAPAVKQFFLPKIDFKSQNLVFMLVFSGGPPYDQVNYQVDAATKTITICTSPPDTLIQGKALLLMAVFLVVEKTAVEQAVLCSDD